MSWLDSAPAYQKRLCGYDQPGGFRSVASSYSGALLTVGTRVRLQRGNDLLSVGVISHITETPANGSGVCLVRWLDGTESSVQGRHLMREGRAR